jgi:hypothetical protein
MFTVAQSNISTKHAVPSTKRAPFLPPAIPSTKSVLGHNQHVLDDCIEEEQETWYEPAPPSPPSRAVDFIDQWTPGYLERGGILDQGERASNIVRQSLSDAASSAGEMTTQIWCLYGVERDTHFRISAAFTLSWNAGSFVLRMATRSWNLASLRYTYVLSA